MKLNKKNRTELPLLEPIYSTFHYQGAATAILVENPSIRNWYLNNVMELKCDRKFLSGYTTPLLTIANSSFMRNPHIEKIWFPVRFFNGCLNRFIRNMIDEGYYIAFNGIDDYYINGKTWFKERHFEHDGLICGYDQNDKTFCIYAYDSNWIYQKFWTPQSSLLKSYNHMFKEGLYGSIYAIRPQSEPVTFDKNLTLNNIRTYLNSDLDQYPEDIEGDVYGIVVHDYICKYVGKLLDGSIPYERMDRRVFRLIWEHKKIMLERIQMLEKEMKIDNHISQKYANIVSEADMIRMLYASHHIKRRDNVLPAVQDKLSQIKNAEQLLLNELINISEEINNAMGLH